MHDPVADVVASPQRCKSVVVVERHQRRARMPGYVGVEVTLQIGDRRADLEPQPDGLRPERNHVARISGIAVDVHRHQLQPGVVGVADFAPQARLVEAVKRATGLVRQLENAREQRVRRRADRGQDRRRVAERAPRIDEVLIGGRVETVERAVLRTRALHPDGRVARIREGAVHRQRDHAVAHRRQAVGLGLVLRTRRREVGHRLGECGGGRERQHEEERQQVGAHGQHSGGHPPNPVPNRPKSTASAASRVRRPRPTFRRWRSLLRLGRDSRGTGCSRRSSRAARRPARATLAACAGRR